MPDYQTTTQDPAQLEQFFQDQIANNPDSAELLFEKLDAFFFKRSPQEDLERLDPHFRWYTWLLWRKLASFPPGLVVDVAVSRQIPTALKLGVDVWDELMWYLAAKTSQFIVEDRVSLYREMQNAFMNSAAIMGIWKGVPYTVKEAVLEIKHLNDLKADSMQKAELDSKIKNILFPKDFDRSIFPANPEEAMDRFAELVDFFSSVKPDNINDVIEAFVHPKIEPKPEAGKIPEGLKKTPSVQVQENKKEVIGTPKKDETANLVAPAPKPSPTKTTPRTNAEPQTIDPNDMFGKKIVPGNDIAPPAAFQSLPRLKKEQAEKTPAKQRVALQDIKKQIELQFKKDDKGQFLNITDVLGELERIAVKMGDDKIRDLYFFNEESGKFEWNEKLLAS